jgi:hypothetical protein
MTSFMDGFFVGLFFLAGRQWRPLLFLPDFLPLLLATPFNKAHS